MAEIPPSYECEIQKIDNHENFSQYQLQILNGYFQRLRQETKNDIQSILHEFNGHEEQLLQYLRFKKKCGGEYDDNIQGADLEIALMKKLHDIQKNTQRQLSNEKTNIDRSPEIIHNIDFRIQNATAIIKHFGSSQKEYILNHRIRPQIIAKGNNIYEIILTMKRNSNSSLRGDEKIKLHFSYDGYQLIFFRNRNNNSVWDRNENGIIYEITHKKETKIQRGKGTIYQRGYTQNIKLDRKYIAQQGVKNIKFTLYFQ